MNDGHVLVIIIAAFVVVQTVAVGIYKYFQALADLKSAEACVLVEAAKNQNEKSSAR